MTVAEMARMGGAARDKAHSKAELRKWAKQGGRPAALDPKALARLQTLLGQGKSQIQCAEVLGVSARTIGRALAKVESRRGAATRASRRGETP